MTKITERRLQDDTDAMHLVQELRNAVDRLGLSYQEAERQIREMYRELDDRNE